MRTTLSLATAAAVVLLAACGTTEEPVSPASEPSASSAGPVSVTDSRGK